MARSRSNIILVLKTGSVEGMFEAFLFYYRKVMLFVILALDQEVLCSSM